MSNAYFILKIDISIFLFMMHDCLHARCSIDRQQIRYTLKDFRLLIYQSYFYNTICIFYEHEKSVNLSIREHICSTTSQRLKVWNFEWSNRFIVARNHKDGKMNVASRIGKWHDRWTQNWYFTCSYLSKMQAKWK